MGMLSNYALFDTELLLRELTYELMPVLHLYAALGVELEMPLSVIHSLENQYMRDGRRMLTEIMQWWLSQGSRGDDIWGAIVESLKRMGELTVADNIRRRHSS